MVSRKKIRVIETGEIFDNARRCAEVIHGSAFSILEVCHGRQIRHMGHTYEFVEPGSEE
jgi:hypothetical protein